MRLKRFNPLLTTSLVAVLAIAPIVAGAARGDERPFTAQDLVTMRRITDPQPSPDGKSVAYVLRTTDLDANRGKTDLWLVDASGMGEPRRLTTHDAGDWNPRFSPDGKSLYFLSTRSGSSQVWRLPLSGGEAAPVTELELDVSGFAPSPDGQHLAFAAEVFVDCEDLACTKKRLDEREASKRSGKVFDKVFVRHWDTWKDGRRSHLFVASFEDGGSKIGTPVDVTAGLDADVPTKPFGGFEEVTFTPDSKTLVFTARVLDRGEPWSTDFNLWAVPVAGGEAPRRLTSNPAWDTQPVFSPDGKTLAYMAMARPGFEADRFRIILRSWPGDDERVLAEPWDRSVSSTSFSPDGKTLYVTAQDDGHEPLFAIDVASGEVRKLVAGGRVRSPSVAGDRLVYGMDTLSSPVDLFTVPATGGEPTRLTDVNADLLAGVRMGEVERFSFAGANGDEVSGWLVKPVGFDETKSWPLAFLIHGGPQGSWLDDFHYRWNPQVYAGAGYAAVMIDFHGSTGYGQAFTDAISGDWGGKPLEDLQKGLAHALDKWSWIDGDRACALGASYGGYMINWIAGHWQAFRCLVNHDGLFDLRSMYYGTEELWFPEWEMGGPPFENPESYARHNPALFVDQWQTPMLVVHGELDYRVPIGQGLQTFTALERRGVPARLLYFPDENHWVLQPQNSLQWHEEVFRWLDQWLAGENP